MKRNNTYRATRASPCFWEAGLPAWIIHLVCGGRHGDLGLRLLMVFLGLRNFRIVILLTLAAGIALL